MASITSNSTEQQREIQAYFSTPVMLEKQDVLAKQLTQLSALITFMSLDNHIDGVNPEIIRNMLWLAQDQIEAIQLNVAQLTRGTLQ